MRSGESKATRERRNTQGMSPNGVPRRLQEPPFFTVQIRRNSPLPIYRQSQHPAKPAKLAYTNESRRDCGPSDFLHSTVAFLYLLVNTGL